MLKIRDERLTAVHAALETLGVDVVPDGVLIERPARKEHGDWSTNAALVCSKQGGANPAEFGQHLTDALIADPLLQVDRIEVAGPSRVDRSSRVLC